MSIHKVFNMKGLSFSSSTYSVTYGKYTEFFHSDEHVDSDTLDGLDWLFEHIHKLHLSGRV